MHKISVSNIGFGQSSPHSLKALNEISQVKLNEASIRFDEDSMLQFIGDSDILIAGTEKISKKVIESSPSLKLIARVGVGIDNIDLEAAKDNKITICYTPDAPSLTLPEFTLSLMLNLIKGISLSDRKMHEGIWHRSFGRNLSSLAIGVVGVGKIGKQLINLLRLLYPNIKLYAYDPFVSTFEGIEFVDLKTLLQNSDIISLHVPLTSDTANLINSQNILDIKKGSYLINTSRGGVIDEQALFETLQSGHLSGAALDVFEKEPYKGPLTQLDNCLLTSHIGSMTYETRALMEEQVTEDITNFIKGKPLLRYVDGFNF